MIALKTLNALEFDKICSLISKFCVLDNTKENVYNIQAENTYNNVKFLLDKTSEAYHLLYTCGIGSVEYFESFNDELLRAKRNSTLSMGELLKVRNLLKSSRLIVQEIQEITDEKIVIFKDIISNIYYDRFLENSISEKILSSDKMSDNASERLFYIRKNIKDLNERIRERLNSYIRNGANKYLQDNIVSIRSNRYVIPVKAECKGQVKGLIHDSSKTGSTLFIEPTEVLELNNELRTAILEEQAEIEKILYELSVSVGMIADRLSSNLEILEDIDLTFAKAEYSYKNKCVYPNLNTNGFIDIKNGRHPLIDRNKVVPVSISFGKENKYVLVSGPNTGGKTVTLKLVGLIEIMAMCGIFVPCIEGTEIAILSNIFVDVGDEQSIEFNLSTFSSHLKNIIEIANNVDASSLVLIDEIGAGTDPEEAVALSRAVIEKLLEKNSVGIITTHYSSLKEYAFVSDKIVNASMEFDSDTYKPLYRINIGMPGTSNALEIAKLLGLNEDIIVRAKSLLNSEKTQFESVLKEAEIQRIKAEKERRELENLKVEQLNIYNELKKEREKFNKEKQQFLTNAKVEARKLVNEKLSDAEDLLLEMKEIFNKETYTQNDLVKMATLKNKLENKKYDIDKQEDNLLPYKNVDINTLKVGDSVYLKSIESVAEVTEINKNKQIIWVNIGNMRVNSKPDNLLYIEKEKPKKPKNVVTVNRKTELTPTNIEINVLGKNVDEALILVDNFIDKCVIANLEEVKIVHGKGMRVLGKAIQNQLKTDTRVKSFRFGIYGEGEDGVTFVTLK